MPAEIWRCRCFMWADRTDAHKLSSCWQYCRGAPALSTASQELCSLLIVHTINSLLVAYISGIFFDSALARFVPPIQCVQMQGGALYFNSAASVIISQCSFSDNRASVYNFWHKDVYNSNLPLQFCRKTCNAIQIPY